MFSQVASVIACLLIASALYYRRQRRVHIPLMSVAFLIDLGLLLYIEASRHAIHSATHQPHPFVLFHIALSTVAGICYLLQIYSGIQMTRGRSTRRMHRCVAPIFLIFRFGNLITSFWVADFIVR